MNWLRLLFHFRCRWSRCCEQFLVCTVCGTCRPDGGDPEDARLWMHIHWPRTGEKK